MKLAQLLERVEYQCTQGDIQREVTQVVNDSRKVTEGSLFICIKGAVSDGHKYAGEVVEKGAKVLVAEDKITAPEDVTVIQVADTRYAMALIAAAYYGHPAEELKVIGITGTKGKTTTTYMVKSILESAGHKVGLIGTIEAIIGDEVIPAANTTPESTLVQEYFRRMADAGCDCVVMEVSSQGLMLHRTAGFTFEIGIFTNIEPDHIGPAEHESFEDYLKCKAMLFKQCKLGIFNADDDHLDQILEGHTCEVETYGFSEKADLRATGTKLVSKPGYLGIAYHVNGLMDFDVEIDIPGKFSVYNSLTAIAICRHFGVKEEDIVDALGKAKVKGRIEMIKVSDAFTLMIDYAHNAMSLESLLSTLKEYHPKRLVCVFGCGGNRAKSRRYEMGEVSGRLADFTIITSDNPRFEKPEDILADIETGISKTGGEFIKITDRKEAIAYAIHHGMPGDVIVLAGKGHEDYQEIEGKKYPMDERILIREILEEDTK
ncbi:UDP-N-acetylmuramoyl-L-alanyl-D-glutamate--2,6-diaminopimelate ligase [uncultured Robinsoniella sp.]|uniref:UDP-N-acetylmuramoyl-L-alanyl-D-glutamate--2, 6-diaminopimelate ligase n=1 Tax=uncultured Robinsoniella sp. TaxID=904190 RepID=UPI00374F93B6